jgi:hypothetical protein
MNRSGSALASLRADPEFQAERDLLVLVDDFQIPLGTFRFRPDGSAWNSGSARSEASAEPLRFMNVVGLSTRTAVLPTVPSVARARSARRKGGNCQCSATASASRKPALCRVAA